MLRELKETESTENPAIYEDPDVPCFENKNHKATCFCITCKEDFCQNCFNSTHSPKIFSTHQSIPLSEKHCEIPKCPIHEEKEIRYFCTDDECALSTKEFCDECLLTEHKSHWYESIETRIKKNEEVLQDAVKNLKERETKMLQSSDAIIKCLSTFDEKKEGISQKRKAIESHFDNMKREAVEKFDNWLTGRKKNLEFKKESMQNNLKVLTATRREIEKTLLKKGSVLNVKELIEKSKRSVDSDIKASTLPYNDYIVPDDMSQEPYPKNSSNV
ncbi:hypothetical protein CRE_06976 [Caenorhabditis remanei]|uniref:B box-type domain-containing protein n=1 Tax=Caenorhabditis remanei TaxID=31234 RepID=E3NB38_CAERE|nr:hypothetical protein CRE_06976 [Caenorhabditis remanei]